MVGYEMKEGSIDEEQNVGWNCWESRVRSRMRD